MFEAIVFLKKNKCFWDVDEIARVGTLRLKTSRDSRSAKLAKEVEDYIEREGCHGDDDDD